MLASWKRPSNRRAQFGNHLHWTSLRLYTLRSSHKLQQFRNILVCSFNGMQELTLKHFLLKQRVLCFYRQAIRASRCKYLYDFIVLMLLLNISCLAIPDTTARKETLWWIRGEIQRNRYLHDVVCVSFRFIPATVAQRVGLSVQNRRRAIFMSS